MSDSYVKRVLLSIDQFFNTITAGDEDETVSSRVGRGAIKGDRLALVLEKIINAVFFVITFGKDRNHCRRSIGS